MYEIVEPIAEHIKLKERIRSLLKRSYRELKAHNLDNIVSSRYRLGLRIAKEEGSIETFESILENYYLKLEEDYKDL